MRTTLECVYRNGKSELVEQHCAIADETRVLVTVLALSEPSPCLEHH